eukprot:NODE_6038_length_534_cov_0.789144.p3 GENE.NODE_6038_length_534_cov_0.789144~~NODE_6038_length_534_cov_0.789144.p3  ORF type:complete len:125 (-),score=9.59 NODE_6038_length_534_cov_0.789144:34-408(-)
MLRRICGPQRTPSPAAQRAASGGRLLQCICCRRRSRAASGAAYCQRHSMPSVAQDSCHASVASGAVLQPLAHCPFECNRMDAGRGAVMRPAVQCVQRRRSDAVHLQPAAQYCNQRRTVSPVAQV